MNEAVNDYVKSLLPEKESWEIALEKQAKEENIPIMEPVSMDFVKQLIRIKQPETILEIGTAIGYSALAMYQAYPHANIVTIERDNDRFLHAKDHIRARQKEDQIHVIHGDALNVLDEFHYDNKTFDIAFIDAAKGQYQRFFEKIDPLLTHQGLIISDNVLFKGYVAHEKNDNNRHAKLAKKMRKYNTWLSAQKQYSTSFIPIGDGVAISLKKQTFFK